LRVTGEHRREIDRARPLRAVEAPHRLRGEGIHVHGFRTIAPARRDGQRDPDVFPPELVRARRRLRHTANTGVGDDALHLRAIGIAQGLGDQLGRRLRQFHRLLFEGLADAAQAAINGGTNANARIGHVDLLI
jgi:hypothetical protein